MIYCISTSGVLTMWGHETKVSNLTEWQRLSHDVQFAGCVQPSQNQQVTEQGRTNLKVQIRTFQYRFACM